jgi:hypothetical protein
MKKFCAIACTVGFSVFWIFGGLALVSFVNGQPISAAVLGLCALGLGVGVFMRRKVVELTQHVPQGTRVVQQDTAAA